MMPAMKEVHTTSCHWKILNMPYLLPVKDVEAAIQPQEQDIMSSDILDVLQTIDHEKLRQNGHRLQPNTKRPQKIYRVKGLMSDHRCQ